MNNSDTQSARITQQRRVQALKGRLPKRYVSVLKYLYPDEDWKNKSLIYRIHNIVHGRVTDELWISRLEEIAK